MMTLWFTPGFEINFGGYSTSLKGLNWLSDSELIQMDFTPAMSRSTIFSYHMVYPETFC